MQVQEIGLRGNGNLMLGAQRPPPNNVAAPMQGPQRPLSNAGGLCSRRLAAHLFGSDNSARLN